MNGKWLWKGRAPGAWITISAAGIGSLATPVFMFFLGIVTAEKNGAPVLEWLEDSANLAAVSYPYAVIGLALLGIPAYLLLAHFNRAGLIPLASVGALAGWAAVSLFARERAMWLPPPTWLFILNGAGVAAAARWWVHHRRFF